MLGNFTVKNNKLYIGTLSAEDLVRKYGSPLYVYDASIIRERFQMLKQSITYPKLAIHFACKANPNPEIMKVLRKEGAFVETVSPGEVVLAEKAGFQPHEILFTSSNISKQELQWLIQEKVTVNLDSLTQLRRWGELNPGSAISIRLNQGIGSAHHVKNITGGPESKFGIDLEQLDEVEKLTKKFNLRIINIHQHIGTGSLNEDVYMQGVEKLLETASTFKHLEYLDFGGGFGVPYKEYEKPMNMQLLGRKISNHLQKFMKAYGKELTVRFEPGRFLVAESGILLTTVTDIKKTPYRTFVGTDSGFNHLVRPMMYDSYHVIANASCVEGPQEIVSIAGNLCESGDLFATDRRLTAFKEDDIVVIFNAGAYGYSMASMYSSRSIPREILIDGDKSRIIREQRNIYDYI